MTGTRIITASNDNGNKEEVYFTEDFDTPATDFISPDLTINCDKVIDEEMPSGFPMNYTLKRS